MSTPANGIEHLDDDQCWALLETTSVGRLAVDLAGRPDIFPINFICDDRTIVFRTAAGTKLAGAALMHHVAFEIDGFEPTERVAWSVVMHGWAQQIERMHDVYDAQDLPLFPWVAYPKPNFVRITPRELTGRRFHVLDDVTVDTSLGRQPGEADGVADSQPPVSPD